MRPQAHCPPQSVLTADAATPDLGRGEASRAFDLALGRHFKGMSLTEIKTQLRAEGYSEFAIQLFEPSISRLIKQGLMAPRPTRDRRGVMGSVLRWLGAPKATTHKRPAPNGMEDQLRRQIEALFALRQA